MTGAAAIIQARAPGFRPRVGVVLGSGLGDFAAQAEPVAAIDYADLPGFPQPGVHGHAGRLVLGHVGGTTVAILAGRAHYYEHGDAAAMKPAIRALKEIGCEALVLTNAAGSLRPESPPGSLMLIADHINFTGQSPLFGETGNSRFFDMAAAYDPALRARLRDIAARRGIVLGEGVYIWFCGPSFETPAEIRAAKTLGADAVGMSTVPEVILARHLGMKVAALSVITNMAAGMGNVALSHEQTLAAAKLATGNATVLLKDFLGGYG